MLRSILMVLMLAGPVSAGPVPDALAMASAERQRAGLPPLRHDKRLAAAAEMQARHMALRQRMEHAGPNGSHLSQRIGATGYRLCHGAENVAWGQDSVGEVTRAWMGSPGHRGNILNPNFTEGAVAAVRGPRGRIWWAMVLASRC